MHKGDENKQVENNTYAKNKKWESGTQFKTKIYYRSYQKLKKLNIY